MAYPNSNMVITPFQQLPHFHVNDSLELLSLIPLSLAGPTTTYLAQPLYLPPPQWH